MSNTPDTPKELKVSRKAVDKIIGWEITSIEYYNKRLIHPSWPTGDSGVTIGIGYDLGYNTRPQIISDWRGRVKEKDLQLLLACSGIKGQAAKKLLDNSMDLRAVKIDYQEAWKVFVKSSLPRYAKDTLKIYPHLGKLYPDAIGGLISMIFNRGNSLEGDRRAEMRAIVPLVAQEDYNGIAAQISASKRLWEGKNMDGLITRRKEEAELVKNSNRKYSEDELLTIPLT
jgi:GH24 family phage-related lysozyme (muramidase)